MEGSVVEVYLLNDAFKRISVIDEYVSFRWTDRYNTHGEFKLIVSPTLKAAIGVGRYISQTNSDRVMMIESVLEEEGDEGDIVVSISGRSMEAIFHTRVLSPNQSDGTWSYKEKIGLVVSRMVETTCIAGSAIIPEDVIPELYRNYAEDTDAPITVATQTKNLFDAVKETCDSQNIGFRIQLLSTSPRLRFNIYKGDERPDINFSRSLDNLEDTSHLVSNVEYKNVAYVFGKDNNRVIVPAPGVSYTISGLRRRVLYVDGSGVDPDVSTIAEYQEKLRQHGLEELGKQRRINLFSGKASVDPLGRPTSYRIGDIVNLLDNNSPEEKVRISEYIWAHDSEGYRTYVTFDSLEDPSVA